MTHPNASHCVSYIPRRCIGHPTSLFSAYIKGSSLLYLFKSDALLHVDHKIFFSVLRLTIDTARLTFLFT